MIIKETAIRITPSNRGVKLDIIKYHDDGSATGAYADLTLDEGRYVAATIINEISRVEDDNSRNIAPRIRKAADEVEGER